MKYIDEYYPQILANSENGGVHFSFISDRDAAGKYFIYNFFLVDAPVQIFIVEMVFFQNTFFMGYLGESFFEIEVINFLKLTFNLNLLCRFSLRFSLKWWEIMFYSCGFYFISFIK